MSARHDYPYNGGNVHEYEAQTARMCEEIDRLRATTDEHNPYNHDHNPLNADFHGGMCSACEWEADRLTEWDGADHGDSEALREGLTALVAAAGRMLDGWAEGDPTYRNRLWQALHQAADDAAERHEIYPL